ncbi:MAG: 2-oxo acid dehydrogenase subunit E2 [Bacteroidales bacterium]|nr:2-oxo acid dehydrogenase subunit E2 [Bacteroidales bacterium]
MAKPVIMPRQGQSVESCILTQWFKNIGDKVEKGDLLFAYETDKAAFEEEAPEEGVLLARYYEEGDEVPVLENVAMIGAEGEPIDQAVSAADKQEGRPDTGSGEKLSGAGGDAEGEIAKETGQIVHSGLSADGERMTAAGEKAGGGGPVKISPRARKLAEEKRVIYDLLKGSGPGGRIIERDILEAIRSGKRLTPLAERKMKGEGLGIPDQGKAPYGKITSRDLVERPAEVPAASAGDYTDKPLSNMRKLISAAMFRSLQNSAQLTHHLGANASALLMLRKQVKSGMGDGYPYNITLNDMICYAVVRALKRHPGVNAHFLGDAVRVFNKVNLGVAVDTERGLMVPVLLNADDLSLTGLSSRMKDLADSAKKGNISPDLLTPESASFTVSNLGNYGVEMFTPVINLPQVAILGVNTIVHRPAILKDGSYSFQPFIGLSLTYDHRALDGGPATLFLVAVKEEIEKLSDDLL